MKEDFKALQRLTQIIAAACAKYPHNREIIEAFRPVMLACRRLAQAPLEGGNVSASLDEESFKAGVPLLRQNDLIKDAPWEELALDLIPKVVEGLPALCMYLFPMRFEKLFEGVVPDMTVSQVPCT